MGCIWVNPEQAQARQAFCLGLQLYCVIRDKKKMDAKHPTFPTILNIQTFNSSEKLPADAEFPLVNFIQFGNFDYKEVYAIRNTLGRPVVSVILVFINQTSQ